MTPSEIREEIRETTQDLKSFESARQAIQARISELDGMARQASFVEWAATQVILNGLIMAIVRCEGLIEDYQRMLESKELPDNVIPISGDLND